jgi:hypothetical protein
LRKPLYRTTAQTIKHSTRTEIIYTGTSW